MREKIILIVTVIILVILAVFIFGGIYFYNFGVLRRKKKFMEGNPDLSSDEFESNWKESKEWFQGKVWESIQMKSYDGLNLYGNYLRAEVPTDKTVILVHGYTGRGSGMAFLARYYHEELGYNVLMPDLRGHGDSQGNYIGFGWHDRKDLIQWVSYILEKLGNNSDIVLHGISMGGGTVLMTSGENLPENVRCIVSDCAYTSAKDILIFQMKKMFNIPSFPLIQITSIICKLRAGYFFGEASALEAVKRSKKPMLFIHGSEDKFVPTKMVYPLYEALNAEKELFIVPKAGHGYAFWVDEEGYKDKVQGFLNRFM